MPGLKRTPLLIRLKRLSVKKGACRVWIGSTTPRGYPQIGKGGHGAGCCYAHRVAFELTNGPIPKGFEIHHKCENKRCINPKHLEAITSRDHGKLHLKKRCGAGHLFMPENTYVRLDTGTRQCKTCRRLYARNYYQIHKNKQET